VDLSTLKFNKDGLIAAIIQDSDSEQVLMLGWMNLFSLQKTLDTGLITFWSRSRQKLWTKGESSGNFLYLKKMAIDCDQDSLLFLVEPAGPTCHTGHTSCFYNQIGFTTTTQNQTNGE